MVHLFAPSLDNQSLATSSNVHLKPPQLEHEQQAYVPYVYARDCLAKVMDDMKKMKYNHIRIVGQIEDTYKMIEDETQVTSINYHASNFCIP